MYAVRPVTIGISLIYRADFRGECRPGSLSVKIVLVDFHTHTTASDGALSPEEILQRARDAGVSALAITDHDTVAGYRAAAEVVADYAPLCLVPGVEFSCRWSGTTIHVVGLGGLRPPGHAGGTATAGPGPQ